MVLYLVHSVTVVFGAVLHGCACSRMPRNRLLMMIVRTVWRSTVGASPKFGDLLSFRVSIVIIGIRVNLVLPSFPWSTLVQPAVWYTLLARATTIESRLGLVLLARNVPMSRLTITTVGQ